MADYAIGLSFHKAHRTLIRAVGLTPPGRYFATRDSAGWITLPTLETGSRYIEIQGAKQGSFSISDNDNEFRLLGDDGWSDSVITGSSVSVSVTTHFSKNSEIPAGAVLPVFKGDYEEGFNLIQQARYDKNYEIYIEFLKELGQADGSSGDWIYDFTGFNGVMSNYKENMSAEGLTEVSFDLKSRGRPMFGRYNAGATALSIGAVQSSTLSTAPSSGTRRYTVVPADNASAVSVSADLTVTYTSDGTVALTQLALGQSDGSGFRLENASSGALVPAVVSLASNVVTINPSSSLAAATIYRLRVADGAITQAVDGSGTASPSGVKKGLAGFSTTFRTA